MFSLATKNRDEGKRKAQDETTRTNGLLDAALAKLAAGEAPPPKLSKRRMTPEQEEEQERAQYEWELENEQYWGEQYHAERYGRYRERAANAEKRAVWRAEWEAEQRIAARELAAERAKAKADAKAPLLELFDGYARDQGIAVTTAHDWRGVIDKLIAHLGHDDAALITVESLNGWINALKAETTTRGTLRDPRTIKGTYLAAIKATLNWGIEQQRLKSNPATSIVVRVPTRAKVRERDFTTAEARKILAASLVPASNRLAAEHALARRWVPWLCAYTGARVNEIGQLRAEDVEQVDGVWCIRITPEAGTVKTNAARRVPLHAHLIEQGFLAVAAAKGTGPLFYDPGRQRVQRADSRFLKRVGQRLADWVRDDVGITDRNVQPNHGWRHTFKTAAGSVGMPERVADAIQGHSPPTESRRYGHTSLVTMATEIAKLPPFDLSETTEKSG